MALKVIGSGFGRTGTMSLKLALERLGFEPCYHMVEVFQNPQAPGLWLDAAEGRPDWEAIFEGYAATVDWPSASFYETLARAYPEAKVVHTERDAEAWFRSTQATIFAQDLDAAPDQTWARMVLKVVGELFEGGLHDKETVISAYKAHNARVREVIPAERLLVYEVAQGWEPLCRFLGVDAPDGPMPKVNTTEEFQARAAAEVASSAEPV
jgi:hypothetical protein